MFLIFHDFLFSRHTPGPTVCISHFFRFSVFLAIFQVIECLCLIFHVCQFSCQNPGPTVCVSHFARFSVFLAIFQVLACEFLIFSYCSIFSPYYMLYSTHFSLSMIFSVSRLIPGPTVCISHFPHISVFSPFIGPTCLFLIFHVFEFSHLNLGPTVCISHFPHF